MRNPAFTVALGFIVLITGCSSTAQHKTRESVRLHAPAPVVEGGVPAEEQASAIESKAASVSKSSVVMQQWAAKWRGLWAR